MRKTIALERKMQGRVEEQVGTVTDSQSVTSSPPTERIPLRWDLEGKKKREGKERKGKNWEDWWLTASASPIVQINRLNKRVKCCGEVDGVVVVWE